MYLYNALCTITAAVAANLAAAPEAWRPIRTWSWRAELPPRWTAVHMEKQDPQNPRHGQWAYRSPDNRFELRLRVTGDGGLDFDDLVKATFQELQHEMPALKVLRANSGETEAHDAFYLLGDANLSGDGPVSEQMVFRVLLRGRRSHLAATVTFSAQDQKPDDFSRVILRFMESFALLEPPAVTTPVKR